MPSPSSCTVSLSRSPAARAMSVIVPPGRVCRTAFSSRCVQGHDHPLAVEHDGAGDIRVGPPRAVGGVLPAVHEVVAEAGHCDPLKVDSVGGGDCLQQQQPVDQPLHAGELGEHDGRRFLDLARLERRLPAEHVEVSAGDRDRRQELVRGVRHELALAVEVGLEFGRQQRGGGHSLLPPADMEHHGQEHQRHQRHLGQLRPRLAAGVNAQQRHDAGRDGDECDPGEHPARPPGPESIEDGEADVDEVKRHRLQPHGRIRRHQHRHRGEVGERECEPGVVDGGAATHPARQPSGHAAASARTSSVT